MLRDTHSEPGLPLVCPLIDDKFEGVLRTI